MFRKNRLEVLTSSVRRQIHEVHERRDLFVVAIFSSTALCDSFPDPSDQ
jgi:hypothetical protein